MVIQNTNEFQATSEPVQSTIQLQTDRPTQTRIRLRIPKNLHEQPVISRLISHHGSFTVNHSVSSAMLVTMAGLT